VAEFQPFVPADQHPPEFTLRAILLGSLFGLIFGAVTVYVGLRAGLTVAASIPIAVISISFLRSGGKVSVLECIIVQTAGNAGQSIAAGVIFTLPALIFLGFDLEYARIFMLALIGGYLGVLFMVPLRKQLIVDEHETLKFPEGTACADVLKAGAKGGSMASRVFFGLGLGAVYTFFQNENLFGAWPGTPEYQPDFGPKHVLKGASINANATSEYMGVGYIIGIRTAGVMLAGGVVSWLVLMPLIYFFGKDLPQAVYPGTVPLGKIADPNLPGELWKTYIRPMGAGAVAAAGLITLIKTLPTIVKALQAGFQQMRKKSSASAQIAPKRTEHDFSMGTALVGAAVLVVLMFFFLLFKPVPGAQLGVVQNLAASLLIVVFGFLFVTVSSRIVGLIGSSANPISGMTIATLMATAAIFLVSGWTAPAFAALAITVGGVVCIASAEAGDTSQDLKTGFLIGATPYWQRFAFLIGIAVSTIAIGFTLNIMNTALQEFREAPHAWDINAAHDGVKQQDNPRGLPDEFQVIGATTNYAKKDLKVVEVSNSPLLPAGKYLYSTASGRIEAKWIPAQGGKKAEFPRMTQAFDLNAPQPGITVSDPGNELPDQVPVVNPSTVHHKSEYIVLNALGSAELADGKYLYATATKQIEVQWVTGIGGEKAPAPQARLMATVINGILSRKLPWGLVLLGVSLVVAVELLGIRSLAFAVGAYLSIGTTLAIFCGGLVRWLVDAAVKKGGGKDEGDVSPGSLFASGLIAAGGICGLAGVALRGYAATMHPDNPVSPIHFLLTENPLVSVLAYAALAFSLFYFARKPMKK